MKISEMSMDQLKEYAKKIREHQQIVDDEIRRRVEESTNKRNPNNISNHKNTTK